MNLTNSNYFSRQANIEYMSVSQFKAFDKCEAAALAELKGEYIKPKTTSMLVGSYVDAYFEGSLDRFIAENPEVLRKDGGLRAEFRQAEEIIKRIKQDETFMHLLSGKKQQIFTGEIEGIKVKIKIDSLLPDAIVDLKVMKDFSPIWKDGERMPWFQAWGYDLQGAVYQAIEGNKKPFILAAVTKETVADIQGIEIPQDFLNERLGYFKGMVGHFDDVKKGLVEPTRCEHCDYCKATKKMEVIDARQYYYEME